MYGKIESTWFNCKKWEVISTVYKLFEYAFWWKCLEFSYKMDLLTIQMTIFSNIKHCHAISLKLGDIFFASQSICSTIKKKLVLYFRKFLAFLVAIIK